MQTQLNPNIDAPMVRCGVPRVKSLAALLDEVRHSHPHWWASFEDTNLSSPGADLADVLELSATAPGGPDGLLAGFVLGLYVNS